MKNFTAHTDRTRTEMLKSISLGSIEELYKQIPIKMDKFDMGQPLSELETQKIIKSLAKSNATGYMSFVGGGTYNKFIPAGVNSPIQSFTRGGLTSFTGNDVASGRILSRFDLEIAADVAQGQEYKIGIMKDSNFN